MITVFGGNQTRPNIHIGDMVRVYDHILRNPEKTQGVFNAGFENKSILEIAELAKKHTGARIEVSESNDPRSYRLSSKKLMATGFQPEFGVEDAIHEVMKYYKDGTLQNKDDFYNLKVMKRLSLY